MADAHDGARRRGSSPRLVCATPSARAEVAGLPEHGDARLRGQPRRDRRRPPRAGRPARRRAAARRPRLSGPRPRALGSDAWRRRSAVRPGRSRGMRRAPRARRARSRCGRARALRTGRRRTRRLAECSSHFSRATRARSSSSPDCAVTQAWPKLRTDAPTARESRSMIVTVRPRASAADACASPDDPRADDEDVGFGDRVAHRDATMAEPGRLPPSRQTGVRRLFTARSSRCDLLGRDPAWSPLTWREPRSTITARSIVALQHSVEETGATVAEADLQKWMGTDKVTAITALMELGGQQPDAERVAAAFERFRAILARVLHRRTRRSALPGVEDALARASLARHPDLADHRLLDDDVALPLLEFARLDGRPRRRAPARRGRDHLARERRSTGALPDPPRHGADRRRRMFVACSPPATPSSTCWPPRNAGVIAVGVLTGALTRAQLAEHPHDHILQSVAALPGAGCHDSRRRG